MTINNADGNTYHVGAEGGTTGEVSTGDESVTATDPGPATLAVRENGSVVDDNVDSTADASDGDVWVMYFDNEVVLDSPALEVDGELIEDGANATFSADGDVLTVTLTQDTTVTYPGTIDSSSGIESVDGEAADFSLDDELEDNGVEVLDEGEDEFTEGAGETEVTLEFNEQLVEVSAENEANYTYSGGNVTNAELGADGRSVTLTLDTAIDPDDTLDIETTLLDDDGQGATATTLTAA